MSDETLAIDEWLYASLTGDSTLAGIVGNRVYSEMAPDTATFPFVLFAHLSSVDVPTHNQYRIMVDAVYVVRGIVQDMSYNAESKAMAEAIDRILHRSSGGSADSGGALIFTSQRTQPFRVAEQQSGKSYRHLGGQYRIYAQSQD